MLARIDGMQSDPLRAVGGWLISEPFEHGDYPTTSERRVDLDRQTFARTIVHDVERSKDASVLERIAHEIH